jgi:hypothetical protein
VLNGVDVTVSPVLGVAGDEAWRPRSRNDSRWSGTDMAPEDAFASCRLKPRRMTDVSDLGFPLRVPRTTIAGGAIGRNMRAS